MTIRLTYSTDRHELVSAFYIHSENPDDWLNVLNANHLDLEEIHCYPTPKSIADIRLSGVFVILKTPLKYNECELRHPFYQLGNQMYLPFNTELFPPVTKDEINGLSLYPIQCFHKDIGLIGWEKEEALNWKTLSFDIKKGSDPWDLATHRSFTVPKLTSLSLISPESENEVIDELESEIDKKDLSDIPLDTNEKRNYKDALISKIAKPLLKGGLGILGAILGGLGILGIFLSKLFPNSNGSSHAQSFEKMMNNNSSKPMKPNALHKLHEWLKANLDKLEKQQQKELNKLLKMFDNNISEALKYAIPLGGDELGRGDDVPSFKLSKSTPSFNLGRLGTRVSSYGWDLGNHYYELRQKYIAAAKKELELKNFRKAAYIYAHLLKDYHNAANVLEQGAYYEEAAVLYLKKMKNKAAAASCYEKGMLYEKAIEIQKELGNNEKIGDLYALANNKQRSEDYYSLTSNEYLDRKDFLNAARVQKEKLKALETSKTLLLEGWKTSSKSEICLTTFFNESFETTPKAFPELIHSVYKNDTSSHLESKFLNVLQKIPLKDYAAEDLSTEIAYQIVSKKITQGNHKEVHKLKHFVTDSFLESDLTRFMTQKPRIPKANLTTIKLDTNITWTDAIAHRESIILTGNNLTHWFVCRVNKYGNKEYYTLNNKYAEGKSFTLTNNPLYSDEILILFTNAHKGISEKLIMHQNKYFERTLTLSHYYQFQEDGVNFSLSTDHYFKIDRQSEIVKYDKDSKLIGNVTLNRSTFRHSSKIQYAEGFVFMYSNSQFNAVEEHNGVVHSFDLKSGIKDFTVLNSTNILVKTYSGIAILGFVEKDFRLKIPFFSSDFFGEEAFFLGSNKAVVYSKQKIVVFAFEQHQAYQYKVIENESTIKCLPISRSEIAVLTSDKEVLIYSI